MDKSEDVNFLNDLYAKYSRLKDDSPSAVISKKEPPSVNVIRSTSDAGTSSATSDPPSTRSTAATKQRPQKRVAGSFKGSSGSNVHKKINSSLSDEEVPHKKRKQRKSKPRQVQPKLKKRIQRRGDLDLSGFNQLCIPNIVSSTPKVNCTVLVDRYKNGCNMEELSPIRPTINNKVKKMTQTDDMPNSIENAQHSEVLVDETVQNVEGPVLHFSGVRDSAELSDGGKDGIAEIEPAENLGLSAFNKDMPNLLEIYENVQPSDVLVDESVQLIEGPVLRSRGSRNSVQSIEDSVIVINEDDYDSDVQIVDGPSTSSAISKKPARRTKNQRNLRHKRNTGKNQQSALPKSLERISEEDNDGHLNSGGLRNCPICLESLMNREISSTTCGHVFCTSCILDVIKIKKPCPTCRTAITKKKIHPLFL